MNADVVRKAVVAPWSLIEKYMNWLIKSVAVPELAGTFKVQYCLWSGAVVLGAFSNDLGPEFVFATIIFVLEACRYDFFQINSLSHGHFLIACVQDTWCGDNYIKDATIVYFVTLQYCDS